MVLQFLAAMIGEWAFAVLFHTPPKYYLACAVNGALGWVCYLFLIEVTGNKAAAVFLAVLLLALLSRSFAVLLKAPATVFLLTGIFPLVPGAGIYYTAYYLMQQELVTGGLQALEVMAFAGSIALGILLGSMVPQRWFLRLFGSQA